MKFKVFVAGVNAFLKEHPEAGDMTTVTSRDSEGNGFSQVYYSPDTGHFDGNYDFMGEDSLAEYKEEDPDTDYEVNAVCVN